MITTRKHNYSLFSLEESDGESNPQIVREEQLSMTYGVSRCKRKISYSTVQVINKDVHQDASDALHHKKQETQRSFATSGSQLLKDSVDKTEASASTSTLHDVREHDIDDESDTELDQCFLDKDDDSKLGDNSSKRMRYKSLDNFRALKAEFLQQFMTMLYIDEDILICTACLERGASILCLDCFHFRVRCQSCVLKEHAHHPLHCLQYFDSFAWQRVSLKDLGLKVYLGHNGNVCPAITSEECETQSKTITVIDIKGIQDVDVLFCACENLIGVDAVHCSQLIRHGWYPATTESPKTVATFSTLDVFEALSGESKISGYHFYKGLVWLKDGLGCDNIPKRYEEFMRMTREYQFLKMVQRAGKFCDPEKPLIVGDGELAVECPACPHPGKNLPKDWEKGLDAWIYTLFIMIDANFWLKSKKKRSVNDLDLGGGNSYFVKDEPYKEYLRDAVVQKEIKYCDSGLRAVDHASLRGGRGYEASGVVGVQCRHMRIRSNGMGDLQKGEKYANVDYIVLSSLKNLNLKRVTLSYDINCQYSCNFAQRMSKFDPGLRIDLDQVDLNFVIPQFHIAGHGESCRTQYNLRYCEHVGQTDGENIERGWAALNPLSMASKEMGSGSRRDYLNWHIGDWNYQRIVSFGPLFSRKLKEAVVESIKHTNASLELRRAFPKGAIKEIEDSVKQWNLNPHGDINPYAEHVHGVSLRNECKALAEVEAREENAGLLSGENKSVSYWLAVGLELEDSQSRAKNSYKKLKGNNTNATSISVMEQNYATLRKIRTWKSKQLLYMPRLSEYEQWDSLLDNDNLPVQCWTVDLNLPSSITRNYREVVCPAALTVKEFRLRRAQAKDSLDEIRLLLQKQWWLTNKKKQHVYGQGQKRITKSNFGLDMLKAEWDKHVDRYRRARAALVSLQPDGKWQRSLKVLEDEDLRPMEDDEGKGEGRRMLSWIWRADGAAPLSADGKEVYEGLKVEYAKCQAQARRWLEEVQLVREEMRRVISYINWKMDWWLENLSLLRDRKDKASLGCIIYGNRQICILQVLGHKLYNQWASSCDINDLPAVRSTTPVFVKTIDRLPILKNQLIEQKLISFNKENS